MKQLEQRWRVFHARRDERRALLVLGQQLDANAAIAALDVALLALEAQIERSLQRDREEYAAVGAWARPLVVLRGALDRTVQWERRRRMRAERAAACVRLGEDSLQIAQGPAAEAARAASAATAQALAEVSALPQALVEAGHLGRVALVEARGKLVPRVPALVGLAVGWWIAQTFTDSGFAATLHSWGIGSGPRRAVRSETLQAMRFWLPLVAAALCSYAGSRLAALVKARYSPPPDAVLPGEQPR